jgi:hypothetical protein
LNVCDLISEYRNDPASVTDENKAAIRAAAFKFSREVKSSEDWRVTVGRHLAATVLV